MAELNTDQAAILITVANNGYVIHLVKYDARSPVKAFAVAAQTLSAAVNEGAAANDSEQIRIAADKTELISLLTNVVNNDID
jgi:hypothetical protein